MRVIHGDCVEQMAKLPEASVDAVVCDPPYGLEFMGKEWDSFGRNSPPSFEHSMQDGFKGFKPLPRPGGLTHEGMHAAQAWHEAWAREALRVLKPGGHLLAFGGTRTYHRLACAVEDAGFEIRDSLIYLYGSGFPKSLDVSKAIDKAAGAEREVVGRVAGAASQRTEALGPYAAEYDATAPATPEAEAWQGWGTALKPAHEPIVVARKPLAGTVAGNVQRFGTGALNVDGCRVGAAGEVVERGEFVRNSTPDTHEGYQRPGASSYTDKPAERSGPANTMGRWPANVALSHTEGCVCVGERRVRSNSPSVPAPSLNSETGLVYGFKTGAGRNGEMSDGYADEDGLETVEAWECVEGCPVAELDRQSGERPSGAWDGKRSAPKTDGIYGEFAIADERGKPADSGGASRFFYTAKASRAEREAGLASFAANGSTDDGYGSIQTPKLDRAAPRENWTPKPVRNSHPTVKPIDLMRWLVRLVTPPGGTVLDPFLGSGTTGCAAVLEGFDFIGIEREADYVKIAEARIAFWREHPDGVTMARATQAEVKRGKVADAGQASIFDLID